MMALWISQQGTAFLSNKDIMENACPSYSNKDQYCTADEEI